jgi:5'-deoxynucleotidase
MLRSVREIESLASQDLLSMVPDALVGAYRPLLSGPEREPDLMRWVKAADALDAYLKCAVEFAAGNREFAIAERQLEAKARGMAMPEVDYFLEHFAPSFRKTLDELTQ